MPLIRRAPKDLHPLIWELPGGGCENDDGSVLYACACGLREETGLIATAVGPLVQHPAPNSSAARDENNADGRHGLGELEWSERIGGHFFHSMEGGTVCKFYFIVDVADGQATPIALDPNEYVAFVSATEGEATNPRMVGDDRSIVLMPTKFRRRYELSHVWEDTLRAVATMRSLA